MGLKFLSSSPGRDRKQPRRRGQALLGSQGHWFPWRCHLTQPWGVRCWRGQGMGGMIHPGTCPDGPAWVVCWFPAVRRDPGLLGAGHVPSTRSEQIVGPHPRPGRWTFRRFTTTFPVAQTTFHLLRPENSPSTRPRQTAPPRQRGLGPFTLSSPSPGAGAM